MALSRRSRRDTNTWPGFVDALATILMVIIFLLMIFVIAQFFLNEAISGRDKALESLEGQVSELADLLGLERRTTKDLRTDIEQMSMELQASVSAQDDMRSNIRVLTTRTEVAEDQVAALDALREKLEKRVTALLQQNEDMTDTLSIRDAFIEDQISELAAIALEVKTLDALKAEMEKEIMELAGKVEQSEGNLLAEKELSTSARAEVALLTQQTEALRQQLRELSLALDISEALNEEQDVQIQNLGQRLNAALATKVHELSQYRSEFFGRLREILGQNKDIQIVGDRFVLQSELLFEQGSADLGEGGQQQMAHLAKTLSEIAAKIPGDIDWVLRVDGHTDSVPIQTVRFPSNWELSAARAISVVQYLIKAGLPANRLAATGFGEFQPISSASTIEAMQDNRRIELKLTER
ncbi:MAG: peptidoglycan -binding protein [Rhodospirillales bacterium]|jgi:chemotaxis protein MotB|nr:peptidoglycan -binding protein [Rhodospirillales bacterium]MBT4040605.1 peptidoglycan -binding protein [Rhodospirillales bacterium]MBT4628105.1 peptidoglycan -binding protein [Rhodospirillales bacterium]MBT5352630.1 peptidoglycan -binding protein [Rhodospirillales bacterium]MBT5520655.1 peptidoglycan -binding protein [Rhodospirillales bacterium]